MWRWRRRTDEDFREEIKANISLDTDRFMAEGLSPEEARNAALCAFGNVTRAQEHFYEWRRMMWLDDLQRDLRYALRPLFREPAFAASVIFTLALGIAAATVVFSVAYNVLVDPLPYRDFERSVVVSIRSVTNTGGWRGRTFFPPAEFMAIRDQSRVFDDLIGYQGRTISYEDGQSTRLFRGANVTANTLDYLGVQPLIGRPFNANESRRGAAPVFAINHRLWQSEFGGDPDIVGRTFVLDDAPKTLVAIMPPGFEAFLADIWVATPIEDFGVATPLGRLRPGVSLAAAAADLDVITHRYASENPSGLNPDRFTVVVQPFLDSLIGRFRQTVYGLLGAVLLLLLIACANAAGLLLTRTIARERELALRVSIGATRSRLVRQSFVETLVLTAAASAIGTLLAYAALQVVVALMPAGMIPPETTIHMNVAVLGLSLGIVVVTTFFCGLTPAMYLLRYDWQLQLKSVTKGVGGTARHSRLRRGLVVAQIALVMVLLVGAGALVRSFLALTRIDLGFNPSNILYVRPFFPRHYNTADLKNAFTRELLQRMQALPGVVSVAESMLVPPLTHDWSDTIIPGKTHSERWETRIEICSEGYFQTIGLRLVRGSLFTESDVAAKRLVTVVNETFARRYFPDEDPLGRKVKFQVLDRSFLDAPHDAYFDIIGVVADHRTWGGEWQTFPQAFFPYSVQGFSFRTFLARTAVDPDTQLKIVRDTVWAIDPSVGISASGTIDRSLRDFYRNPQFDLVLVSSFAAIGLVIMAFGIFGVMAYTVSIQTHEIGVRMAIGARRAQILRGVLVMGSRLVAAGVVLGLGAAYFFSTVIVSSPTTFTIFSTVAAVGVCVGLLACYLPAHRATKVNPVVALRCE